MKNNHFAFRMNRGGELIHEDVHNLTREKYKPDSFFLCGPISYILMIACVLIDVAFFKSLFEKISYDSPEMIWLEVAGLAFAADIVAAYAGVLAKRIYQGLSKDKMNLTLLLSVPILALVINGVLRYATMPLTTMDGTVDAATIALTIISIATPVFTSVGNFAISFQTYDPLGNKMCREEIAIDDIRDYCRRLEAIKEECEDFDEEEIRERDRQHLANGKMELMNDALIISAETRVKLMEYLGDPASTNVLSKSYCDAIFDRLDQELEKMKKICSEDALPETKKIIDGEGIVNFSECI